MYLAVSSKSQPSAPAVSVRPSVEIQLQLPKNVLRICYFGVVTAGQMREGAEAMPGHLAQLRVGFTVLTDLSQLERMDLDSSSHLARIMDLCKAAGVGRVIRVMPDRHKDIGLNILSLIHYRGKIPIITCDTLAEAERALG